MSERFRLGGARVVDSAVRMLGSLLPGGKRKRGTHTVDGEKRMSATRQYFVVGCDGNCCSS